MIPRIPDVLRIVVLFTHEQSALKVLCWGSSETLKQWFETVSGVDMNVDLCCGGRGRLVN